MSDHLRADILYGLAKLTRGTVDGETVVFSDGHVSNLCIGLSPERRATFALELEHVDVNQLSVILGVMKVPPVIDLTSITMEPDGTSRAFRPEAGD